jgi:RNA polymerase sigma factor (TIGR02999 family)
MMRSSRQNVTELLVAWSEGNQSALDDLTQLVYHDLHRLAHHYMRSERPGHLLQTTALINETYLRLIDWKDVHWKNRAHFIGICAQLMRRILVDFARSQSSAKRGGKAKRAQLDEAAAVSVQPDTELVAIDEALKELAEIDARKSKVVELRFFGGLSVDQTAEVMDISPRTVMREWSLAQAWLHDQLQGGRRPDGP